jgi:hypothetical protein
VHSAYHATPGEALAGWRAGVGDPAAAGVGFTPVDDPLLLAELMPAEQGMLRTGGENVEQFAEYHRSKRLSEAVIASLGPQAVPRPSGLDRDSAAREFTAWLQAPRCGQPAPEDLDEQVAELADSWCINDIAPVYAACSPHRVALTVLHLRNYYQDDFAAGLIALLPDWTEWLAQRNGTAPELAQRCRPYAQGQSHVDVGDDDSRPHYLARVIE